MGHDTIASLIVESASRNVSRTALTDAHRTVTYGEMVSSAARLSNALRGAGITKSSRIALLADDSAEAIESYLGVWLADCTVVHVSAKLAAPEVQRLLEDADVAALLYSDGLRDFVSRLNGLDDLRAVWSISGSWSERKTSPFDRTSDTLSKLESQGTDTAIIAYTSGTSGAPKGAVISHRALTLSTLLAPYSLRIPRFSRLTYTGSLSFPSTLWAQVLPHLWVGGVVNILGPYDIESWLDHLSFHRSTFTYLPSPLVSDFVDNLRHRPEILEHLQTVFHAGSAVSRSKVAEAVELLGNRYLEAYGATETVGPLSATVPSDYTAECEANDALSSAGRPLPSATVWIAREDGSFADKDEEGEIVTRADTCFDGYFREPDKTLAVLSDGVYRTGDMGRIDGAGYIYVSGRHSELIVSGGMNVYPAEIERVLLDIKGVREVAVFGIEHDRWGETVAAAIVTEPGVRLDVEAIVAYCRSQLASYKKPTSVGFVEALPLTPNLKVDKSALRASFEGTASDAVHFDGPERRQ
jgi:acyl-CoA synthetase (AMP-forming)/AMP-acid ligase II